MLAVVPAVCSFVEVAVLVRLREERIGLSSRVACALDLQSPGFAAGSLLTMASAVLVGCVEGREKREFNFPLVWCSDLAPR